MTPLLFVAVALAGGIGAVCRFVVDGAIRARVHSAMPWATILINLTGSFALGFAVGLVTGAVLDQRLEWVLGVGFLGGYTTFSTASYETVRLMQAGKWGAAVANGFGVVIAASTLAGLGLWLGAIA